MELETTLIEMLAKAVSEQILKHLPTGQASSIQPMLLSVAESAVYLGRSPQAIQHLIFDKSLPVVRVGRRVHLDRRDLDKWIEQNKY
jgi:excisionase family DNA binding protein